MNVNYSSILRVFDILSIYSCSLGQLKNSDTFVKLFSKVLMFSMFKMMLHCNSTWCNVWILLPHLHNRNSLGTRGAVKRLVSMARLWEPERILLIWIRSISIILLSDGGVIRSGFTWRYAPSFESGSLIFAFLMFCLYEFKKSDCKTFSHFSAEV